MHKYEFKSFYKSWLYAHEISATTKQQSKEAIMQVFDLLADYSFDSIQAALKIHSKKSKFAPTVAEIIDILDIDQQRLSADEAWAICPASEEETVVWTEEMADAYTFAAPLLADGDKIAARMAFKKAYERLCTHSAMQSTPLRWKVSVGFDKSQTQDVVDAAVEKGWLSRQQARRYIPAPMEGGVIGGLLAGKVVDIDSEKNTKRRANLQKIKQQLADIGEQQREDAQRRQAALLSEQESFEAEKAQLLAACAKKGVDVDATKS